MCGIFGQFSRAGPALGEDTLRRMGASVAHRGPDHLGLHLGEGIAMGNQRLYILDIEHGSQPFYSDDGQIVVVQNGEIFNFVELAAELEQEGYPCHTRCDTEVLLRLYERDGIGFVHRLNGMFAIAVYDARERRMILVRDRIGVKPLYLWEQDGRLTFASEIKALVHAGLPRGVDLQAVQQYLAFNYVPPPRTLFEGVRHLLPGHYLVADAQRTSTVRWWRLADQQPEERSEEEWKRLLMETLDDAVRIRLRSDAPFGAFLSGGIDSSTVVGLMAAHMERPVRTFSIGFDDPRFDESAYAEQAARRFGTEHVMERVSSDMLELWPRAVWHCDQAHGDVSFMPTYRVSELAARHVRVVLTGDGGDELFAGYDKYRAFFQRPDVETLDPASFREAYARALSLFAPEARRDVLGPALIDVDGACDPYAPLAPVLEEAGHLDRINQALYVDMMLLLPGNNLIKPDRMGMAVSLEARTPFLDYRMMELAFRMPGHLKLRDGETKYLLKRAVEPLIGTELAYRAKQMFTVPIGEWFKRDVAGVFPELLLSERTVGRALFSVPTVRGMLDAHQSGRANYTREIRALIALELWMRIFIDGEGTACPEAQAISYPIVGGR